MQAHHMTIEQTQAWLKEAQRLTQQRTPPSQQSPTEQAKSLTLQFGIVVAENQAFSRRSKALTVWKALHCGLRFANVMNVDLPQRWGDLANKKPSLAAGDPAQFQTVLVSTLGTMAKAMEATDHFENFPSRQVMEARTVILVAACITRAKRLRMTMDLG